MVAATLGILLLTGSPAQAQTNTVPITGSATAGSGGSSLVATVGDLKKFLCTSGGFVDPVSGAMYCINSANYDDDPGGNPGVSNNFMVSPNLGDNPLEHNWKIVFIDFHGTNDVTAIEKDIYYTAAPDGTHIPTLDMAPPVTAPVWSIVDDLVNHPTQLLTGTPCQAFLGDPNAAGSVANGLVATGQVAAADMQVFVNRCIQQEIGVIPNNFPISKHLPCGTYTQAITLTYKSGGQSAPFTRPFTINCVTGFQVDFTSIVLPANLSQNSQSVLSGDWNISTSTKPTIMGLGNTEPVLSGAWQWLVNANGGTPKYIQGDFDIQINRCGQQVAGSNCVAGTGSLVEEQHIDGIQGAQPPAFGALATLNGTSSVGNGTSTGTVIFAPAHASDGAVCLEPNEPLKLDFSVTPRQPVFAGTYTGNVKLSVAVNRSICEPGLAKGESATGDSTGVFDNNPSQQ